MPVPVKDIILPLQPDFIAKIFSSKTKSVFGRQLSESVGKGSVVWIATAKELAGYFIITEVQVKHVGVSILFETAIKLRYPIKLDLLDIHNLQVLKNISIEQSRMIKKLSQQPMLMLNLDGPRT